MDRSKGKISFKKISWYCFDLKFVLFQLHKNFIHRSHSNDLYWSTVTSVCNAFYLIFATTVVTVFIMKTDVRYDAIPVENPLYDTLVTLPESFNVMFLLALYAVNSRMKSIKKLICGKCSDSRKMCDKIILTMKLHDKIYRVVESFNRFFSVNCMSLFLQIEIFFILIGFSLYDVYGNDRSMDNILLFIIGVSNYSIMTGCFLIVTLNFIKIIRKLENEILKKLIEIESSFDSIKVHRYARLAMLQMKSSPLIFSCGLIAIDRHIWIIIAGSIVNYLLITIQFDSSEQMKVARE